MKKTLQLVPMTYEEAYEFAGETGMNAFLVHKTNSKKRLYYRDTTGFKLVRLCRADSEPGKLIEETASQLASHLGFKTYRMELDPDKYDIYCICWQGKLCKHGY